MTDDERGIRAITWYSEQSEEDQAQIDEVIWAFIQGSGRGIQAGLALALGEWRDVMDTQRENIALAGQHAQGMDAAS